uniref:F-box/FBD/LRR-repeat protein At5g56420-like n=1 Tax=Erigeron canadensis TaxID=72917 RepID=UPI001CB954C2|nr:F-box/FBD/LRR-repeat protein At5g56420-like [Erigeron canadensis]
MANLEHIPRANNSTKRKHQEPNINNNNKKKKIWPTHYEKQELITADQYSDEEDRLTNLPEPMKLHILSLLSLKQAIQTSALSKSWVSSWTSIPVLTLNSGFFFTCSLCDFDKIVTKVLACRDKSVKLNKLTFSRGGISTIKILKTVFSYALSNGVKQVRALIKGSRNGSWPDCLHNTSSDSLTRLKLISCSEIRCQFLGHRLALFKNLTNLYLENAIIMDDPDAFSGFLALEKLTLYHCCYKDDNLNIRASQLSVLNIMCFYNSFDRCELSTPKLRIFKFRARTFPVLVTPPQALPVLDEVVLDYQGSENRKQSFQEMITMFSTCHNAKSLTISMYAVLLLSRFWKELVKHCSPFRGLKFLKLDEDGFGKIPSDVKDYLLQYSVDAIISVVYIEGMFGKNFLRNIFEFSF